jgi:hypothetical protein
MFSASAGGLLQAYLVHWLLIGRAGFRNDGWANKKGTLPSAFPLFLYLSLVAIY